MKNKYLQGAYYFSSYYKRFFGISSIRPVNLHWPQFTQCCFNGILLAATVYFTPLIAYCSPEEVPMPSKIESSTNLMSCGTIALQQVARVLKGDRFDTRLLLMIPAPASGLSLTKLNEIAETLHLGLAPMERDMGTPLIVPSVAHYNEGHYVAIVAQIGDSYEILDPTLGAPVLLTASAISARTSGAFLVPVANISERWHKLSKSRTDSTFGTRVVPGLANLNDGCDNGSGGCNNLQGSAVGGACSATPCGVVPQAKCKPQGSGSAPASTAVAQLTPATVSIPTWEVSEPYINLWLYDEPLGYQPGVGNRIAFKLSYKQRADNQVATNAFSLGNNWNVSWLTYILDDTNNAAGVMTLPGGGQRTYVSDGSTPEYYSQSTLTRNTITNRLLGFIIKYPNGSIDYYNYIATNQISGFNAAFITARVDATGYTNRFIYNTDTNTIIRLTSVIDGDGHTNLVSYTNTQFPAQITGVSDPFGRQITLQYGANGYLTNVTDVMGTNSSFAYNLDGSISNFITPYGTTTFSYTTNNSSDDVISGSLQVVNTVGGIHLYVYRNNSQYLDTNHSVLLLPASYPSALVPTNIPTASLQNGGVQPMYNYNSFHWGPLQYSHLSTTNVAIFTVGDYLKAGIKHWLLTTNGMVGHTISMEIAPSADGFAYGQMTWFDYDGKYDLGHEGTNFHPSLVACVIPDGTTQYTWNVHDRVGHATNIVDTYSSGYGLTPLYRTNSYIYKTNAVDLSQVIGPQGELLEGYSYNANHQILLFTNGVGDVTSNSFDPQGRLTMTQTPAGLTSSNIYYATGPYSNWVAQRIDLETSRTNTFSYSNNLLAIHTNELGLVITYKYDALQRLTLAADSRGSNTYIYNKLDLAIVSDPLGFTNSYGYDSERRMVAVTNTLGNYTIYAYCNCGALDWVRDSMGNTNRYYYDNLGRLVDTIYADGTSMTNNYDLQGKLTSVSFNGEVSYTNWYNNQGVKYALSNAFGQLVKLSIDIENRITNSIDAKGVSIGSSYDNVGRPTHHYYPDGGIETYVYSAAGLVTYTNQLTNVTRYVYDAALRQTGVINGNTESNVYSYDAAGHLLSFTDGKRQTTSWQYDVYGRLTNKTDSVSNAMFAYGYDADNRVTSRWTPAKGSSFYFYDATGNVTNITYPSNHAVSFGYDSVNRLLSMVDSVGTTLYGYDKIGQLVMENGPWINDAVNYGYTNRVRASLSLLQPGSNPWTQVYNYDVAHRVTSTVSPAGSFVYAYDIANQFQVDKVTLPGGAFITNTYDSSARLLSTILNDNAGSNIDVASYSYNRGNQRAQQIFTATNYVNYTYDGIGQLLTALGAEAGGVTNRLHEQMKYSYDLAHNLSARTNNALSQNFNVNALNELSNIVLGSTLTVAGTTGAAATNVSVNGIGAVLYRDNTFATANFVVTNGSNVYIAVAKDSLSRQSTNTIAVYLPTSTAYSYDQNGNLLSDGTRSFAYDDENQLITVWVTNMWRSDFTYDGKMRRRIRTEYTWQTGAWMKTNEIHYIYDGNVVVQERDINNIPTASYTRGEDLSGPGLEAGGIGGLLAVSYTTAANPTHCYYHSDGNGNITSLINSRNVAVAKYAYDPYGNLLSISGPLASVNLYRFSSKEVHINSGLVYYLYRMYDANLQRWINRDPLGDQYFVNARRKGTRYPQGKVLVKEASENSYAFCRNTPENIVDSEGLKGYWACVAEVTKCEAYTASCVVTGVGGYIACVAILQKSEDVKLFLACVACVGTGLATCDRATTCWISASADGCVDLTPEWPIKAPPMYPGY